VSWSIGKIAFIDRVSTAVRDAQQKLGEDAFDDGDSEMDPDELVETMMNDFPFVPGEV
jgi:hypothetical protein